MFIFSYITGLFAILCFTFGAFLLYEKSGKPLAIFIAIITGSAGLWALSNAFADVSITNGSVIFWSGMAVISFLFFLSFFLVFVDCYLTKSIKFSRIVLYNIPTLAISLFAFSKFSTVDVIILYDQPAQIVIGPIYTISLVLIYIIYSIAYFRLIRSYKRLSRLEKSQVIYIILGTFFTLAGVTTFDIILPLLGEYRFYSAGPLSTIFMISFLAYAILRHRLLDIRIAIQRGLIYSILLVIITGFYLVTLFILGLAVPQSTSNFYFIGGLITAILGIFGVPKIEIYFRQKTDKFFFKDKYDYSEAIHELSEILNTNVKKVEIIGKTSDRLKSIFKTTQVDIIVKNAEGKTLDTQNLKVFDDRTEIQTLIMIEDRTVGTIAIGKKLSGDLYTDEDIHLLKTFAYQAAVALEKALLYEKVKGHAQELEVKVEERTAQIRKLQEEQKQTMTDISHGLQTPLTIVKSKLDFLKKKFPEDKNVLVFEKSIDEISKFIYDIMSLVKLETDPNDFKQEVINVSQLLNELTEYFLLLAKERKIIIRTKIEYDITIYGNKHKLNEAITNLVSNAFKYASFKRRGEIGIMLRKEDGRAELIVEDNGIGISTDHLANIFNRFYQVKDNNNLETRGTGLGLAIVKKIIEKHGGTISVESQLDKGTKFIINMPISYKF